jgi:PEGA domain-containing protein
MKTIVKDFFSKLGKLLNKLNFKVIYTLLSVIIVLSGSYLAIQYAKGNWRFTKEGLVPETGLLSANSFPTGAQILINDKLVSATDDTLYLEPGEYEVKIVKEGYSTWRKELSIEKELVTQTNALLFPASPSLTSLTLSGVENVSPSPDGHKLVYYTASASAQSKNGLYLMDLTDNILPLQKGPRLIAEDVPNMNLAKASFIWSPDSTELMIITKRKEVLIPIDKKNDLSTLPDIRFRKKSILSAWEEEMYLRERQFLVKFPEEMIQLATTSAKNVYISPDKKRMFYTATENAVVPDLIISPIPATSTQKEERILEPGSIYVYDREEDKNFKIGKEVGDQVLPNKSLLAQDLYSREVLNLESSPSAFLVLQASTSAETAKKFNIYHSSLFINTLQWYPDSRHLLFAKDDKIQIMEYDGSNNTTIYSGPFVTSFVYPWPDGSKLIILTSFRPDAPKNLYAIEIK